jgi:hypothetical protein
MDQNTQGNTPVVCRTCILIYKRDITGVMLANSSVDDTVIMQMF